MRAAVRWHVVRWCTVALCLASAPATLARQQARANRTVLVAVELRAVTNGVPVLDLKPQDLVLRVDGIEQEVHGLDLLRLDGSGPPPPFATNLATGRGRDLIFVIDEESFQAGKESSLRDALDAMLRNLTPRDRAGLVSLHESGPTVAVSARHEAVRAAIPKVRGRAIGTESANDLACRTRRLLPAIGSLLRGLDGGVRTTVLLFSAALAAPPAVASIRPGAETGCRLLSNDFDEFRAAAARSAAQLYAIYLADATAKEETPATAVGLEALAGEAGGQFMRLAGDPAAQMKRIASETASFYVATIALAPEPRGPIRKPMDLRIRRGGVAARARPELLVPALETKTVSPRDMMRVATGYRDLLLRAAGFPSRNPGDDQARLIVLFEPVESSVSLSSAMAGLYNAKGQLVAQWTGEREDLAGRPVAAALVAQPGAYRLRIAAVDSTGRSGAVDDELAVELPAAGSATTSAIVLGAMATTGFSPRLQFTAADRAAGAYLEVYRVSPCAGVSALLDVASADEAPVVAGLTVSSTPIEQSDACILFGEFDLTRLAPADYTVRLRLRVNGVVIGERLRTFRKSGS